MDTGKYFIYIRDFKECPFCYFRDSSGRFVFLGGKEGNDPLSKLWV
jgi:hypothetical protein